MRDSERVGLDILEKIVLGYSKVRNCAPSKILFIYIYMCVSGLNLC